MTFRPKYVTFDCYGTLTNFDMAGAARRVYGDALSEPAMAAFIKHFAAYRLDEVLGNWKPYAEVVHNAVERACKRNGVAFRPEDAQAIYEEVPTWGPHPDVPAGLARVAKEIPLVILSNAMNSQIMSNVEKLGAPFHAVFTAEQTGTYKPRMNGFEYMLDALGCGPEDITHVSSSFRYDLMTPTTSASRARSGSTAGRAGESLLRVHRGQGHRRARGRGRARGRAAASLKLATIGPETARPLPQAFRGRTKDVSPPILPPPSGRRFPAISAGPDSCPRRPTTRRSTAST